MVLLDFFGHLRAQRLSVSVREFLTLLDALRCGLAAPDIEQFYYLARCALIKDESLYDRYDQAFTAFYNQHLTNAAQATEIPSDWLRTALARRFTAEEQATLRAYGWDELMKKLEQRLHEQTSRHAGGHKWIGTGGASPFGNSGYHPEGIRIGGQSAGHRTAVKVWDMRNFRDYDSNVELGPRNFKIALRRLRRFARTGTALELDLAGTIAGTARNAGYLDLKLMPHRRNTVKVLMLLDVGGSMDEHIAQVESLFSAARSEFQHLEVYYFHNCPYDTVWRSNQRTRQARVMTLDLLRTYNADWRLIIVGDATMSPYELLRPGGSVEHDNPETGATWVARLLKAWPSAAWLNPEPIAAWQYRPSIALLRNLMSARMYGVTPAGLVQAMNQLSK